jgi:hypothetical protein
MLAVMPGSRKRQHGGGTAAVLLVFGALAAAALVCVLRNRVALGVLLAGGFVPVAAGLALSAGGCAAGLVLLLLRRRASPEAWRPRLPLRVGLYLATASAAVYALGLQPYRSVVALACFGLAGGLAALLALAGARAAARLPRTLLLALDLLLFAACLVALGGELTLRVVAARSASPLFAQPTEPVLASMARSRLRPEQATPANPVNALGHPDEEWGPRAPGVPRAATIGDSFSVGVVPHHEHFTTVAERRLGRGEICSLGITGIGPEAYLHLLVTEALPLRPDVVVVDLFIGNDLALEPRGPPPQWAESWLDARRLLIVEIPRRLLAVAHEQQGQHQPAESFRPVWAQGGPMPWIHDPALEPPSFTEEGFTGIERRRARGACLPDKPPDWAALFDCLLEMRARCNPTPFAVLVIPDEFQVEDAVWEVARAGVDGERLDRDLPQRVLAGWLAEQGIPFLDLLPALRAVPPMADGNRHLYHLRDSHFNARGNEVVGEELARFLQPWWK